MEVQVVPDARWNDAAREAVLGGLRSRLGTALMIDLKLLDAIAPEASGKYRYVISHVPLQGGLAHV
jgi:phenylacetate-CoA ligase